MLDYKVGAGGGLPSVQTLAEDLATYLYFLLGWHYYKGDRRVRNIRLSVLNLISLSKVEVPYDQAQILRHRQALTELVVSAMQGSLEPRVSARCGWCPVREGCPAWSQIDLADLDDFEAWQSRSA